MMGLPRYDFPILFKNQKLLIVTIILDDMMETTLISPGFDNRTHVLHIIAAVSVNRNTRFDNVFHSYQEAFIVVVSEKVFLLIHNFIPELMITGVIQLH